MNKTVMKTKSILLILLVLTHTTLVVQAQLKSVIVEKYYLSDVFDATDTLGGGLEAGSITYRIFVEMAGGSQLLKVYGDENHPLIIAGTSFFFNNKDRGKSIGKEINANRLKENTLALDTWITLGQASNTHFGILKSEDTDGSIIGGNNNDGGSAAVSGGLLKNDELEAGIPLTESDGLITSSSRTQNFVALINGKALNSSDDTTIFGNGRNKNNFISYDCSFSCNGVSGATSSNEVLIAQLTTKGEITFTMNISVMESDGTVVNYVGSNPIGAEKYSRFLNYPLPDPVCGCKDPGFIEYDGDVECHIQDSCKTKIILGCMDPYACNYDPTANYNVDELCCYPGNCNNRNIEEVCPVFQQGNNIDFTVFPNPTNNMLNIEISNEPKDEINCVIYNSNSAVVLNENIGIPSGSLIKQLDVHSLTRGTYYIRLFCGDWSIAKIFIKN
jgi:hypothetical protein